MKNLKLRTKILAGFIVILVLMMFIGIIAATTNLTTMNSVEEIGHSSDLQTLSKELGNLVWEANIDCEAVFVELDHQNYLDYIAKMALVTDKINQLKAYIAENSEVSQYSSITSEVEASINSWMSIVKRVEDSNSLLTTALEEGDNASGVLSSAADSAYQNQQQLWRKESENAELSYDDKIRRADRLDSTMIFYKDILNIVSIGQYIRLTQDTSGFSAFLEELDRIIQAHQDYIDSAKNQGTKDAAQVVIEVLNPFRENMVEFNTINSQTNTDIENARVQSKTTLTMVDNFSVTLDDAMNDIINSSIISSSQTLIVIIVIIAVSVLLGIIIALVIVSMITRPVNSMRDALTHMGTTGEMHLPDEMLRKARVYAENRDEIGQCMTAYLALMEHMSGLSDSIDLVAKGDLTVNINTLSDRDSIGISFGTMLDNLNSMFREITEATDNVSNGSRQIAEGSQMLAQGSTEQAASVEELSASVGEIAGSTGENAKKAEQAATLVKSIIEYAEKGSEQMGNMITAVDEINSASQSISNVIKIIDDIAFQTNILALNAAVEAARAGEHGKGFAVVADEVRNLAAKSADAAKSTAGLIANSMEKAKQGTEIAEATSASLTDIANGINQSADIITDIASASESQNVAIQQINQGVDQVATVVQQNSATAEESAASAEALSRQSDLLERLVSRYKIK